MLSTMARWFLLVHPSTRSFVGAAGGVGYVTSACYQSDWWRTFDLTPLESIVAILRPSCINKRWMFDEKRETDAEIFSLVLYFFVSSRCRRSSDVITFHLCLPLMRLKPPPIYYCSYGLIRKYIRFLSDRRKCQSRMGTAWLSCFFVFQGKI